MIGPLDIPGNWKLVVGVFFGILYGFVLAKSGICQRPAVKDFLSFRSSHTFKAVLTAAGSGILLFFLFRYLRLVELRIGHGYLWGSILGGLSAGAALAMTGLTPMGSLISLAGGRLYAIWFFLGMLVAMPLVRAVESFLDRSIYRWSHGELGAFYEGEFFTWGNPAIYIVGLLLFFVGASHFTMKE